MNLFGKQNFIIGCNYWASHAGTEMWRDWRPDVIEDDFRKLAELSLEMVRIFPLWPDFQPLQRYARGKNQPYQLRWRDGSEIPCEAGGERSGVDPVMLERFRWICDCALRHQLKLGVGLITGWMSGRIFVPPAFEQNQLLRDPFVIRWQLKLVRRLVSEFREHPAIAFWGVGNECNCMDNADRHAGALWAETIADAIRAEDPSRPLLAGMHGLVPYASHSMLTAEEWGIEDMAEIFDVLTVHPYPLFSKYAAVDRMTGFKGVFHATAEAHFYGDIGRRPCIAEELGTLAPTLADEDHAADYLRNTLLQLWSHDCEGLLWWCGFDQQHLKHPPYQWCGVERQLGLFHGDDTPKPVAKVLMEFARMRRNLPFARLARFQREAVCILNEDQDCWLVAYGSWLLAKQAGFDLEFQFVDEPLRPAALYLVPALAGLNNLPRNRSDELMERVADGATLYLSFDGACIAPFEEYFGLAVDACEYYTGRTEIDIAGQRLPFDFNSRLIMHSLTAEIQQCDVDGYPVWAHNHYGNGDIWFLSHVPERQVVLSHRAIEQPYFEFYRQFAAKTLAKRAFLSGNPWLTVTLHPVQETIMDVVIINNSDGTLAVSSPVLQENWSISKVLTGDMHAISAHDAVVLELTKIPYDEQ